ncbi:hypothetical protein SAMN04489727_6506 [Amycolatopsis tolypomycina]|uniref:Uncharacterized protein n=1 Tax=Amycolatopsis tolypomycina TaxID=208445 RepID=A0A1H4Y2C3_9PSEU|nr:hypothetical protein SAMN04489727_6506 [Amycolatopsis tolypomycina]
MAWATSADVHGNGSWLPPPHIVTLLAYVVLLSGVLLNFLPHS